MLLRNRIRMSKSAGLWLRTFAVAAGILVGCGSSSDQSNTTYEGPKACSADSDCDDGNACTSDFCEPDIGCAYVALSLGECEVTPSTGGGSSTSSSSAVGMACVADGQGPCTDYACCSGYCVNDVCQPVSGVTVGTGGSASTYTTTAMTGGTTSYTLTATTDGEGGSTSSTTTITCASALRTDVTGNLEISDGYVVAGSLSGYGFTWESGESSSGTCISPTCDTAGCTPTFGTTALCATGVVAADTTLNSSVGLGMNINQADSSSGSTVGTLSVSVGITVTAVGIDVTATRVVLINSDGTSFWCVEAGTWTSGVQIPITEFNTSCWDTTIGTFATAGTAITAAGLLVASTASQDHAFSMCITDLTIE